MRAATNESGVRCRDLAWQAGRLPVKIVMTSTGGYITTYDAQCQFASPLRRSQQCRLRACQSSGATLPSSSAHAASAFRFPGSISSARVR